MGGKPRRLQGTNIKLTEMSKLDSTDLTLSDHFAGCGGSGDGAQQALNETGGQIVYALNHWKLATESYETNHVNTKVECTDISACDPRRYMSTTGSLWSPECTTHSPAGGNTHKQLKNQMDMFNKNIIDPATERSRATMWDVVRFTEYHKYEFLIVENVVEAKTRWVLFEDWLRCMHNLGYDHKCVYLNSMHFYPTPQSRDRLYIVFWKKGNTAPDLEYMPLAHCHKCTKDVNAVQCWKNGKTFGKYKTQYIYCCPECTSIVEPYYYASFNCIDWSDIGKRIGDKPLKQFIDKKTGKPLTYKGQDMLPLSPNTLTRVDHGLDKYGDQALIVNDQHSTGVDFRVNTVSDKLQTITGTPHFKLVTPFVLKCEHASAVKNARSVDEILQTQATRQSMAIVTPWIIEMNGSGEAKPADNPISTVTAGGINHALLGAPYLINCKGESMSSGITDATKTFTVKNSQGLVTHEAWNSFISYFNGNGGNKPIHESAPTFATKDRHMLVNYTKPRLEDCYYRMLKSKEVKKGMAFRDKYVVLGSSKDQVKQLGGAVTPPVMKWLVRQCANSLK